MGAMAATSLGSQITQRDLGLNEKQTYGLQMASRQQQEEELEGRKKTSKMIIKN